MGSITENFSNLSEMLSADFSGTGVVTRVGQRERDALVSRFLRPFLPASIRLGTGHIIDVKDRPVGLFDVVGSLDQYPVLGDGLASVFLADGVVFCLDVRKAWGDEHWSALGEKAKQVKALQRRNHPPIFCGAVAAESLPFREVSDFLKHPSTGAIDGVLTIGQHLMVRNGEGWFGDPKQIPMVSERGGGQALKAFAFFLWRLCQAHAGLPFTLSEYQHL